MHIIANIISPNFDERPEGCKPQFVILHYTEMLFDDAMDRLCDQNAKVSAHYLIKKTGEIYNLVPDQYRAWHAGKSYWKGLEKLNDHSIGIEMDNMGDEPFVKEQMDSCIALCHFLMKKHDISRENVIGHSDIAPDRKIDPGVFFDWQLLDRNGIGIPCKHHSKNHSKHHISHMNMSAKQRYLQDMGYKIEVTNANDAQTQYVMRAFESHFR